MVRHVAQGKKELQVAMEWFYHVGAGLEVSGPGWEKKRAEHLCCQFGNEMLV